MRIRYQPHDHFRRDTAQISGLANLQANFWHSGRILTLSLCAFSTALAGHCATMAVRDATATTKNAGADSTSKASAASASSDDSSAAHASSAHSASAHFSSATRTDSARTTTSSAGAKAATSNISNRGNTGNSGNTGHTGKTATKRTAGKAAARKTVRERGPVAPTAQRISEIQSALSSQGSYQGGPTGRWDDGTIDAMKQFQAAHGLKPVGQTRCALAAKTGLGLRHCWPWRTVCTRCAAAGFRRRLLRLRRAAVPMLIPKILRPTPHIRRYSQRTRTPI